MKRAITAALTASILLIAFGAPSCNQTQQASALRKIADASHRIGNTVDKGRQAVNELRRKEVITRAEANAVRVALLDVSRFADEYNTEAAKHTVYDANAKAELQKWVDGLRAANLRLIANGTYHVKNDKARLEISATVSAIAVLIQTITTLIPEPEVKK